MTNNGSVGSRTLLALMGTMVGVTGLSTGGLGMALNWHSQQPVHAGAATQRELEKVERTIERDLAEIQADLAEIKQLLSTPCQ